MSINNNNNCHICYDTDMDYCITQDELNAALNEVRVQLHNEITNLAGDVYTKTEIDEIVENIIAGTINLDDFYTKSEIDAKFDWVYNKLEEIRNKTVNIDEDLSSTSTNPVQNKTLYYKFKEYYSKDQVDELISNAGGGGNVNVDSYLSTTSKNPVQNRVVTDAVLNLRSDLNNLQEQVDDGRSDIPTLILNAPDGMDGYHSFSNVTYDGTKVGIIMNCIRDNKPYRIISRRITDGGAIEDTICNKVTFDESGYNTGGRELKVWFDIESNGIIQSSFIVLIESDDPNQSWIATGVAHSEKQWFNTNRILEIESTIGNIDSILNKVLYEV